MGLYDQRKTKEKKHLASDLKETLENLKRLKGVEGSYS